MNANITPPGHPHNQDASSDTVSSPTPHAPDDATLWSMPDTAASLDDVIDNVLRDSAAHTLRGMVQQFKKVFGILVSFDDP